MEAVERMNNQKKVLWIDEEPRALSIFTVFLQECFGDEIFVIPKAPERKLGEMIDHICSQQNLVALVVDQRLKSTGMAEYTGIDLIERVRGLFPILPIYILTNHQDDIGDLDYQVEYVLEKDNLYDDNYINTLKARVRRHVDVYNVIMSDREIRFDELLRASLERELNSDEMKEMQELDYRRSKVILADEFVWAEKLKGKLDQQSELLDRLRQDIESDQNKPEKK